MNEILNEIKKQIMILEVNKNTIINFSNFFIEVNEYLKGGNSTLITITSYDKNIVKTNLLNDTLESVSITDFKVLLIEYLEGFKDILYDVFILLLKCNIIKLDNNLKLLLFKKIYLSGYFGYVGNTEYFLSNYSYIKNDLRIINNILNLNDIQLIDTELKLTLEELYLIQGIRLKQILIGGD